MTLENESGDLQNAANICNKVIKKNSTPDGLIAGGEQFKAKWLRDALLGSFGILRGELAFEVEKNLDIYVDYQKIDGQMPNRIERKPHVGDFIDIWPFNVEYEEPQAKYRSSQPWAEDTVDTTALFVDTAGEYRKITLRGEKWWDKNVESLMRAGYWLKNKIDKTGLVKEGRVAGWEDNRLISGYSGYTNTITWKAFKELGWNDDADRLQRSINKSFWNKEKGYFNHWIDPNDKPHDEFCADINTLGVVFGLASHEQTVDIAKYIEDNHLNEVPIKTHHPISDLKRDLWTKTFFPNYDTTKGLLMWWGGLEAIVQKIAGEKDKAIRDVKKIAEVITKNGTAPEMVDFNGKQMGKQRDMTWSAGIFLYSAYELGLL